VVLCVALLPETIADRAGDGGASENDKAAIMDVIERQAAAFWAKDFARWSDTWVHTEYVRRVGWSPTGGVISVEGWDAIGGAMKKTMADNPAPNPTPAKLVRDHVNIRTHHDLAWMTFDQHGVDTGEARFDMPGVSHETRILERHDGKWKLVYVGYVLADKPPAR
jgi:hypothetical protein